MRNCRKYIVIFILILFGNLAIAKSVAEVKLKLHWLGTASYLIQFGNTSILTDPFYSQYNLFQVGFGEVVSKPRIVREVIENLKPFAKPKAIFIGHSHYDHMLDTATLVDLAHWHHVPIYGSQTTRHILAGYDAPVVKLFRETKPDGRWHHVAKGVRYKAILAQHAGNIPYIVFYSGQLTEPRESPPHSANHFQLGETYAYVFELTDHKKKVLIYFVGAATRAPVGFPDESITHVDVAILCVPSWQYTAGYPDKFIRRLKPRYIIPSHYNDFFQSIDSFHQPRQLLLISGLKSFINKLNTSKDYPNFEAILVPEVNQTLLLDTNKRRVK